MIDSFHNSLSYDIVKGEREENRYKNTQIDEYESKNDSSLNMLPWHLSEFEIEIQKKADGVPFVPSIITSSLKCIRYIFDKELKKNSNGEISNKSLKVIKHIFDKFEASNILFELSQYLCAILQNIDEPTQPKEDVLVALSIIGYYYCSDPRGISMISQFNTIDLFLSFINDDDRNPLINPILAGIAGLLKFENPEDEDSISKHLLSNHFDQRLIFIYENFCLETPILEIGNIIKSLIKNQNTDQFLPSLLNFIPILNSFLSSNNYEYVRLSIQSARHLIAKFPDARNNLDESGYIENLKCLMMSEYFYFGMLRSSIYFLRFYCRSDENRCREIFNIELNNLVFSLIQKNQNRIDEIKDLLYDIDMIMTNFKFLIYSVLDSDLFTYITQMSYDGPFLISLQCSIILCDIINSQNPEGVAKVIEANFLESLQQVLACDNQEFVMLALDTINDLFNMDQGKTDGELVQGLRSQEWLPEVILDLCDQNENEENVFIKARFIYDNIIPIIFNSEE